MPSPAETHTPSTLTVDRIACTGHGVCASLLPEHVALDEWAYPRRARGGRRPGDGRRRHPAVPRPRARLGAAPLSLRHTEAPRRRASSSIGRAADF